MTTAQVQAQTRHIRRIHEEFKAEMRSIEAIRESSDNEAWEAMHGSAEVCPVYGEYHYFVGRTQYDLGKPGRVRVCRCGIYQCAFEGCENGVEDYGDICDEHVTCQHDGCHRIPMVGCDFCDLHNDE